ncbi:ester cyclase [Streptomyces sp. 7-21]|jgi:hypothetical protein|uniref:ester cyclase n=1 Tax=Streptomyces sp. 7-21 TaxID=2802283 RepID=UPI00191DCC21|nr:nuclear transport factor 2 family protein [Streptomyces sp. 7-21]MBL1066450.1 nuclear transport factor 2 family protein [Streptomyces sp. 7-21]
MTGMTGTTGGVPGDVTGQELYHRWIEEAWNGHPEAVRGLVTADFTGHWPGRKVHGADELAELIASTRRMFTSLRFVIEVGPFAANGLVAGRWSGVGRTDGGEARFFGNDILRVRDGRFAEYWVASGQLGG